MDVYLRYDCIYMYILDVILTLSRLLETTVGSEFYEFVIGLKNSVLVAYKSI